jgi:hypothetical protein
VAVGDKKFGVVLYVLVGGLGVYFGYTALHCALIDRISLVKYLHGMFM